MSATITPVVDTNGGLTGAVNAGSLAVGVIDGCWV